MTEIKLKSCSFSPEKLQLVFLLEKIIVKAQVLLSNDPTSQFVFNKTVAVISKQRRAGGGIRWSCGPFYKLSIPPNIVKRQERGYTTTRGKVGFEALKSSLNGT